jgi:hypothetical protein
MKRLSALLAICIALSAASAHAAAPTGKKPASDILVGTVLKVDGTNIVIQTHGKDAGEKTIPTDPKTVFEIEGVAANLAKIKPGMEVAVSPKTGIATKVLADVDKKKPKKKKKSE